ncbi:hypothetical protein TNCT_254071 [Trichonephila clavata]|uniref:Uncharacterized protein n=1 Tax=Trichonephila clavata TaxID=2740835 RepID=A0A8X6FGW9_TRICU|nr:hypothetical protein TNCT_254071 [Trichonephila clavata]
MTQVNCWERGIGLALLLLNEKELNFSAIKKDSTETSKELHNLTLRTTILESGVAFVLSSYPAGKFEPLNPAWTTCEPSAETLVGSLTQDSTFRFTVPKIRNESLLFSLAAFLPGTKQWSVTAHKFAIRSECYYISPNEEATLSSAEFASQDVKSTLIQSPQNSGLQIDVS